VREICGLRDPDGSGEGQFVVEDGGKRAFAWIGFRLGHNGKRGNGFLEASSSSAIKLYEHLRKHRPTRPKTIYSLTPIRLITKIIPNKQRHNHAFPLNKPHYSPSKICITIHAPSPPFLHVNHHPLQQPIHADLARTQKRSQTKSFSILYLKPITPPPRDSHHENPFTPAPYTRKYSQPRPQHPQRQQQR